jgi:Spy/CpxP family protein refolding chaperone
MRRILVAAVIATILATAIYAQRGRPGGPQAGTTQRDPGAALQEALSLTDAQLEAVKALAQTRQERARAIFTEIQQGRQSLDALLDSASPNVTAVGQAAIALRGSQNKLEAEKDWFLTELKRLLTGTQQQTLDSLIAADARLPLLGLGGPGGRGGRGGPGRPGMRGGPGFQQ